MKILIFIITIFIITLFCFATCESKCFAATCVDPINFRLIDKLTQQDLVLGASPRYFPDSMQMNKSPDFTLGYSGNILSRVYKIGYHLQTSPGGIARDTTFLRLTYNDIDTLIITYAFEEKNCCENFRGFGRILSIKYNNVVAAKDSTVFKFEKQ